MKIILERSKCISCGSCVAVCPFHFEMDQDGKSRLKNAQKDSAETESLDVPEAGCAKDAADVCPVQIIKVE